jgi:hypothetical protein
MSGLVNILAAGEQLAYRVIAFINSPITLNNLRLTCRRADRLVEHYLLVWHTLPEMPVPEFVRYPLYYLVASYRQYDDSGVETLFVHAGLYETEPSRDIDIMGKMRPGELPTYCGDESTVHNGVETSISKVWLCDVIRARHTDALEMEYFAMQEFYGEAAKIEHTKRMSEITDRYRQQWRAATGANQRRHWRPQRLCDTDVDCRFSPLTIDRNKPASAYDH